MKGKFFTVIGIVVIFGYFIMESFRDPSDPTQVVMVGNDTLGRDWGAQADARDREIARQNGLLAEEEQGQNGLANPGGDNLYDAPTLLDGNDPLEKDRSYSGNYSTIQSADGREIITGTYGDNEEYDEEQNTTNYKTRRQLEREGGGTVEEPAMIYRE
jgi:hypothetical protein